MKSGIVVQGKDNSSTGQSGGLLQFLQEDIPQVVLKMSATADKLFKAIEDKIDFLVTADKLSSPGQIVYRIFDLGEFTANIASPVSGNQVTEITPNLDNRTTPWSVVGRTINITATDATGRDADLQAVLDPVTETRFSLPSIIERLLDAGADWVYLPQNSSNTSKTVYAGKSTDYDIESELVAEIGSGVMTDNYNFVSITVDVPAAPVFTGEAWE